MIIGWLFISDTFFVIAKWQMSPTLVNVKFFYSENVKKKILIAFDIFNQGRKPEV